jgi:phospholipid/cholesterol/gamma-HCH transport system substrate-binding protein
MKRRRGGRDPFKVGLVVLIVGALITYFGVTRKNPFHSGYRIHAVFTSALSNGLHSGSPVRIAGVNVGKITGVKRGPGTTVDVTMEITDAGRPIHRDATAKARPRIFLEGNFFVDVRPGTASAPEMPDGGTIPLTQTAVPVQFDQFLDSFTSDVRQSSRDVLTGFDESLRKGGSKALRDDYKAFPGALKGTAISMEALRGTQSGDLAGFVLDQARLSSTLDHHRTELMGLITTFRRTMDALAGRQQKLAATVPALRRLFESAPAALTDLDRALPPLRVLSAALRPSLKVAPGVLDHAVPFLSALDSLLAPDRLDRLVTELGPSVRRLRSLERSLPGLMNLVRPVSSCVSNQVVPVLSKQVDDGALSSHQPAWQDLLVGLLGLNSAQQNFGGDGYGTRYSFGLDQTVLATNLNVPDRLVMLSGTPLVGARPRWTPGHQPPYRPDVPCETQPVQSVVADTVPAPAATRTIQLKPTKAWTRAQLLDHLRASLRTLKQAKP